MRRSIPVVVLFFASFVIGEMLLGASTVSRLAASIPVLFYYGGGAILVRESARRRSPEGWGRIVVLGLAYGVFEEGVVIQSLFNPELFKAGLLGGRAFGVNWIWSEWVVGYHAVFSIVIPILLVERLYPDRSREPWLGWKGLTAASILFGLSALVIGVAYRRLIAPDFRAPGPQYVASCAIAAGLLAAAVAWPRSTRDRARTSGPVPDPWAVGLLALVVVGAWFFLFRVPESLKAGAWALIPIGAGLVLATAAAVALDRWSRRGAGWTDRHRLALVLGALPPVMAFGSLVVTAGNRVDQIGQGVISVAVYTALIGLMLRMGSKCETARRERVATGGSGFEVGFEGSGLSAGIRGR